VESSVSHMYSSKAGNRSIDQHQDQNVEFSTKDDNNKEGGKKFCGR
jgi:hypothetical protein